VTGKVPRLVRVRGEERPVQSWVDVAFVTMEAIAKIGEDEFSRVVDEMPKFANRDATAFRRTSRLKKLSNGAYVETNISASTIHRLCVQAAQLAGLDREDWSVEFATAPDEDDAEESAETASHVKQLQLEFWTEVRAALQQSGKFASLQTPRPRHWFDIALGRSGVHLSLTANTMDKRLRVKIVLMPDKADRALPLLLEHRDAIERELDAKLEWNPYPQKRVKIIALSHPANIQDRTSWPAAIAWLTKMAGAFYATFAPRIALLGPKGA
jgi:Domain of unknown function (DUF4268)